MKGQLVSGHQLIDLAESYIEAINRGGIPVIETAWQYMQSGQLEAAYQQAVKEHKAQTEENITSQLPMNEEILKDKQKQLK